MSNPYRMTDQGYGVASFKSGGAFLFDEIDLPLIERHTWHLGKRGYPATHYHGRTVVFHRLLFPDADGEVDHINGDKMDNRRCNLRICTHQQNAFNQKRRRTNTSGFIGVEALQEQNIFRKLAHVISTGSGERKIPIVASKGTAAWIDEEAQYPESDDAFGMVSIGAYKLATMIKVSEELLNDSVFDVPAYIAKEFARRIGAAEEEAFFTGDGKGKPTGILAATGAEVGVTAAGTNVITMDEVMDLFYSLRAPYRRNAVFIMNDSSVKALRKLKTQNGDYIWQPSVQVGEPDKLLGRPIYTSSYMPALEAGAKGILFGDLGYYWVADRQGRSFKRLNELYAPTGQVGFLSSERVDGKLILPEAVKVLQMKASA